MNKNLLESTRRNYFIIGSVLTFFVVGGMTLYAKTGGEGHALSQFLGFEEEAEMEHGTISTSTQIDNEKDEGRELEIESEHGVTTIVSKQHGDDTRERGDDEERDEEEEWDDDHRSGQSEVGSVTPSPIVPSPAPASPSLKTFTMADVSLHANAQSCYTAINGGVYDVTTYIPIHKGGSAQILAICGKDGTSLFSGQHAGAPKPADALANLKIGTLLP